GILDKVIFAGFREDAIDLLNMMDVFAMTSLHEGVPMVLLEAMFLKKPIVSTAVGGIPEIISNNENGILIPPEDPLSFCTACIRLIDDEKLRDRLGQAALQDAGNRFTAEIMVDKTYHLYRRICEA
ncbi:glycosyltransferase, partial [bacterium]|nr:glycosyltransferase [bacterium]